MKVTRISQMELVSQILEAIGKQGVEFVDTSLMKVVCDSATAITKDCQRVRVYATPSMGLPNWRRSDDTGLSSLCMARVLEGCSPGEINFPRDADDFGRCVRLLDAAPDLRANLDLMANHGEEWAKIISEWNFLESLYRSKETKQLSNALAKFCEGRGRR